MSKGKRNRTKRNERRTNQIKENDSTKDEKRLMKYIVKPDFDEKDREAVKRMKLLNIFDETIRQYAEDGFVSRSEPPFGAFYWVQDEDLAKLKAWEKENGARVYLVLRNFTEFGIMDSYLFVSKYKREWKSERELLKQGQALACVETPGFSFGHEIGLIGIAPTIGRGLVRIW